MAVTEYSAPFTSSPVATEYQWSRLARAWGLDGVIADDVAGTDLKVVGNGTSVLTVMPGEAFVNGFFYSLAGGNLAVNVTPNITGSNVRNDRVVLRMDPNADSIHPVYKTGGTLPPALVQDPAGIWEIPLAQCLVAPGVSVVAAIGVTDQRWLSGKGVASGIAGQERPSRKGLLLVEGNDILMGDGSTFNYVATAGPVAYSAYTPVWDAAGTTIVWGTGSSVVGRSRLNASTCNVTASVTVGAIASWPTGAMGVSLPFLAQPSRRQLLDVTLTRGTTLLWRGVAQTSDSNHTHADIWFPSASPPASSPWTVSAFPVKVASGDVITVHGAYECLPS